MLERTGKDRVGGGELIMYSTQLYATEQQHAPESLSMSTEQPSLPRRPKKLSMASML